MIERPIVVVADFQCREALIWGSLVGECAIQMGSSAVLISLFIHFTNIPPRNASQIPRLDYAILLMIYSSIVINESPLPTVVDRRQPYREDPVNSEVRLQWVLLKFPSKVGPGAVRTPTPIDNVRLKIGFVTRIGAAWRRPYRLIQGKA